MAVSITQQPQAITPSDNPIIFAFKQDLANFNHSFVYEVFIEGIGSVGVYETYPESSISTYLYGKVNISNIVAPYVSVQNLKPLNLLNTIYDPSGYANVYITVSEKYSTTATGIPEIQSAITSDYFVAFKGKLTKKEFKSWDYTNYKKSLSSNFLTDLKLNTSAFFNYYSQTLKKEDSFSFSWLDYIYTDTPVNYKVKYAYFNGTTLILNKEVTYISSNQGSIGSVYFNLDQHVDLAYLTQAQADNCTSVYIGLYNASDVLISPFMIVTFDTTCFYNGSTLRWLNKYGAYDTFLFTYNKRISADNNAFNFEKSTGEWKAIDINTLMYEESLTNTGTLNYLKQTKKKLQLVSDWLTEEEQNWLVQLYESPLVYLNEGMEDESIIVTNSGYQVKQDRHDELFNEIVEIEFTTENSIRI